MKIQLTALPFAILFLCRLPLLYRIRSSLEFTVINHIVELTVHCADWTIFYVQVGKPRKSGQETVLSFLWLVSCMWQNNPCRHQTPETTFHNNTTGRYIAVIKIPDERVRVNWLLIGLSIAMTLLGSQLTPLYLLSNKNFRRYWYSSLRLSSSLITKSDWILAVIISCSSRRHYNISRSEGSAMVCRLQSVHSPARKTKVSDSEPLNSWFAEWQGRPSCICFVCLSICCKRTFAAYQVCRRWSNVLSRLTSGDGWKIFLQSSDKIVIQQKAINISKSENMMLKTRTTDNVCWALFLNIN